MPDTFTLTIISIIVITVVSAFFKGKNKDKCLCDFSGFLINLEETSGKLVWGNLRVEHTGMEFVYPKEHKDTQGHIESSYILYKQEYPNIQTLIRFHDSLDEESKVKRLKDLKKTYHPKFMRRVKRKSMNLFKTVKDSMMEVVNLLIGQAKKGALGTALNSQDKYVSHLKNELVNSVGTSFEPLLERHIGRKVVAELVKGDKLYEYSGVLKDYTSDFIEVMDVDYKVKEEDPFKKADLIIPKRQGIVRHLGE